MRKYCEANFSRSIRVRVRLYASAYVGMSEQSGHETHKNKMRCKQKNQTSKTSATVDTVYCNIKLCTTE